MADTIKDRDTYEALREEGMGKGKAAAITNAQANGTIDRDSRPYEERSVDELRELARELDIEGRSSMDKEALIEALRQG